MRNSWILIGYMGCGKTTVGEYLAKQCKLPFLDTDQLIEEEQGCSISRIFSDQGEEAFRDIETACLRKLLEEQTEGVLSVGGGLPLREENRRLLRAMGTVVYLRAGAAAIYERLERDETRPLLQTDDRMGKIVQMLEIREPYYEAAAHVRISTEGRTPEEIAEEITRSRPEGKGGQNEDTGN